MNNYSVSDKVDLALAMAESLAEMHGFEGGVMVNDDIDFGQWLKADDGSVILNDFNNAIYMEWNYEKQEYCKYFRGFESTFKAPEEIGGGYLDESVDIWPMGNLIFGLLTGLFPFYDLTNSEEIKNMTKKGPPYIDPRYKTRSYAEGRMVEIMEKCHQVNATERVDIFEVVRHLRETKRVMGQQ
jgi:serine/threonine protein kinase